VTSQVPAPAYSNVAETFRPQVDGYSRRKSLPSVVLSSQDAQRIEYTLNRAVIASDYTTAQKTGKKTANRSFIDSVKRRSRSADALREMAQSQHTLQAQERRLSDEIKYWRNSVIEDPLPSFGSSRQEMREVDAESGSTSTQTPTLAARRPSEDAIVSPPAFNMNGLMIGNVDASVEQRITTVEVKLIDLECAIANLQGHEAPPRMLLGKPPRRRKALQDSPVQATTRSTSNPAILPQSSFDSFSTGSSSSSTSEDRHNDAAAEHRKSVATIIRPGTAAAHSDASTAVVASHPSPPAQPRTDDEFTKLMAMLTQEQEARRGLEGQLHDLQKQINELRLPGPVGPSRAPPTPGHFCTPTPKSVRDSSPVSRRTTVLPFRTASPKLTIMVTEGRRGGDVEKQAEMGTEMEMETDTEDGFLDVYETPIESTDFGFGGGGGGGGGLDKPRSPMMVGVM
jgi:hypothetical protein